MRLFQMTLPAAALAGLAILALGCEDLFHGTDFADPCSEDPTARGCPGRPLGTADHDEALRRATRACGWLGACYGAPAGGTGACFARAVAAFDSGFAAPLAPRGRAADQWARLAAADSCAAVGAALGLPDAVTCAASAREYAGCAAAVQTTCPAATVAGAPVAYVDACTLQGKTCVTGASGGLCAGVDGAACAGGTRCAGTSLVRCEGGVDVGRDCALEGDGACVAAGEGSGCLPRTGGAACTPGGDVVCAGDGRFADLCSGGESVRVDCGLLGLRCRPGAPPPGAGPLDVCTSGDASRDSCSGGDRCEGARVVACVRGAAVSLDCAAVGLSGCRSDGPGRAVCAR